MAPRPTGNPLRGLAAAAPSTALHQKLGDTVEKLDGPMHVVRRELQFSLDRESGRITIKVVDAQTREVIRCIPPEEAADVARYLNGLSTGLITDVCA